LNTLGLAPLLDLRMRAGEGPGACLDSGLLRSAVRFRKEAGRAR
jgi:NaMN:DMB phosphoribosyltransferase